MCLGAVVQLDQFEDIAGHVAIVTEGAEGQELSFHRLLPPTSGDRVALRMSIEPEDRPKGLRLKGRAVACLKHMARSVQRSSALLFFVVAILGSQVWRCQHDDIVS